MPKSTSLLLLFLLTPPSSRSQGTRDDYQRASQFLPGNLRHRIYLADVSPHWIAKSSRFWYRKAGLTGTEFILVDPAQNTVKPAFDHARLASALSDAAKRDYKSTELPFDNFDFSDDAK